MPNPSRTCEGWNAADHSLVTAINTAAGSFLTAKLDPNSSDVLLTSTGKGVATDYSVSAVMTDSQTFAYPTMFSPPSFAISADSMAGGDAAGTLYSYFVPAGGYAANGNILSQTDSVMGTWNYGYDTLNRLTGTVAGTNVPTALVGLYGCWTYDAFGNRTLEAYSTASSTPCATGATANAQYTKTTLNTALNNNQLDPSVATYDGAGNVIADSRNAYLYDPEGRLCAVEANPTGTATYTQYLYDAEGRRVAKGSGTSLSCGAPTAANGFTLTSQYLLGQSGAQVTELGPSANPATNWVHTNVWEGARLTATYSSAGLTFDIADPLGTKRVQAGISSAGLGVQSMNCLSLPFGNNIGNTLLSDCVAVGSGGTDATEHHFTGKERDAESGNDYFGARYYGSSMGRFMSPDWSAKQEPVPYSSLTNPQTLNLYAYVGNNPLTGLDPDGHAPLDCSGANASGIGCQTIAQWNTQHEVSASAWASSGFGNVNVSYQNGAYTAQQSQTPTANQNTDYASVSYWPKGAGGFGHIGIGVDTDDTQGYSTADPTVPWYKRLFGAPAGGTEDDLAAHTKNGEVAPHGYLHIPITADQAAAMQAAMEARRADPGHYNLFLNNCSQFVESVLRAGGVSGVPHGEVFGPAILGGMLWLGQH